MEHFLIHENMISFIQRNGSQNTRMLHFSLSSTKIQLLNTIQHGREGWKQASVYTVVATWITILSAQALPLGNSVWSAILQQVVCVLHREEGALWPS